MQSHSAGGEADQRTGRSSRSRRGGVLRRFWEGWKPLARRLATFQARLLLTIFYFVILAPFALLLRWTSDPLALKPKTAKGWRPRGGDEGDPAARALRQA